MVLQAFSTLSNFLKVEKSLPFRVGLIEVHFFFIAYSSCFFFSLSLLWKLKCSSTCKILREKSFK